VNSGLRLETAVRSGRTVIADADFTAPHKIMKPLYRSYEYGACEVTLMCASPGMLDGDNYEMNFILGIGTKTVITEQSYRKIHPGSSSCATNITLGQNAELRYIQLPTIPYSDSVYCAKTQVRLSNPCRMIYGDILQCGRTGERFRFAEYASRLRIFDETGLVFADGAYLNPAQANIRGIGFTEGRLCQGFLYIYGYGGAVLPESRAYGIEYAVSAAKRGVCVRAFGDSADEIYGFFKEITLQIQRREYE